MPSKFICIPKALISFSETAARIGVSRSTLERMITRGEFIEGYQFPSGGRRFDPEEIDRWLVSCRLSPNHTQIPKETSNAQNRIPRP